MPATYEPLATTTLSSATGSITFSGISSAYTDLRIVFVATFSTQSEVRIRFNSDTTTAYSYTFLRGTGSSAGSNSETNQTNISGWATTDTNTPEFYAIDVFNYTAANSKSVLVVSNADLNGTGEITTLAGLWRQNAAINTVTLSVASGTISIGSMATLYGIAKA